MRATDRTASARRSAAWLLLAFLVAALPRMAVGFSSCSPRNAVRCCCGDEATCPCAHRGGQAPSPAPAAPTTSSAQEAIAVPAPPPDAVAEAQSSATGWTPALLRAVVPLASSPHLTNCSFRC